MSTDENAFWLIFLQFIFHDGFIHFIFLLLCHHTTVLFVLCQLMFLGFFAHYFFFKNSTFSLKGAADIFMR